MSSPHENPPSVQIQEASNGILDDIKAKPYSVICGRNNSGKSYLLRHLLKEHGRSASYLGPARYQNFTVLAPYGPKSNRKNEKWNRLSRHFQNNTQNIDNSPLNLQQAIAELSDAQRTKLFGVVEDLLGSEMRIAQTIPGNEMSQKYISVDGHNLSFTSSGFRLVTTLATSLLDQDYQHFLIDEPELGLSPEVQGAFADFMTDDTQRAEFFPHAKSVVVATHSPIFLDRIDLGNNFRVEKSGGAVRIDRVGSIRDLNALQFRLLGNRLDTLFLPSAMVMVEGSTDYQFLSRLIAIRFPDRNISVVRCGNDSRIRDVVHMATQMLGDLQRSPYADRVFAVIDAKHGEGLVGHLEAKGIPRSNVVVWDENGIEFVYPRVLLEGKFGKFTELEMDGDVVSANQVSIKKSDLAAFVTDRLTETTAVPDELETKLLAPLEAALTSS